MKGTVAAGAAGAVAAVAILTSLAPGFGPLRGLSSDVGTGGVAYVGAAVPNPDQTPDKVPDKAQPPGKVHTIRLTDGDDEVTLKSDGKADEVWCGAGTDTVVFFPEQDPLDVLHDCEEFLNLYAAP